MVDRGTGRLRQGKGAGHLAEVVGRRKRPSLINFRFPFPPRIPLVNL